MIVLSQWGGVVWHIFFPLEECFAVLQAETEGVDIIRSSSIDHRRMTLISVIHDVVFRLKQQATCANHSSAKRSQPRSPPVFLHSWVKAPGPVKPPSRYSFVINWLCLDLLQYSAVTKSLGLQGCISSVIPTKSIKQDLQLSICLNTGALLISDVATET